MLRLSVIFLWLMLLMTQSARASAEDDPSFTAEDFRYDYAGNGVPTVFHTVVNTGKEPVRPVVKVTVNQAYSSNHDAFHYRKRASLRTKGLPVVKPGGKEPGRLSMGKSLKPGDYEAIVEFPQMEMLIDRRFDFSVAESNQRTVKRLLQQKHSPGFGDSKMTAWIAVLIIVLFAAGAIHIAAFVKRRRRNTR